MHAFKKGENKKINKPTNLLIASVKEIMVRHQIKIQTRSEKQIKKQTKIVLFHVGVGLACCYCFSEGCL